MIGAPAPRGNFDDIYIQVLDAFDIESLLGYIDARFSNLLLGAHILTL